MWREQKKKAHHMTTCETATCRTMCMCANARVCTCVHMCARVCIIKEKAPCKGFLLTP